MRRSTHLMVMLFNSSHSGVSTSPSLLLRQARFVRSLHNGVARLLSLRVHRSGSTSLLNLGVPRLAVNLSAPQASGMKGLEPGMISQGRFTEAAGPQRPQPMINMVTGEDFLSEDPDGGKRFGSIPRELGQLKALKDAGFFRNNFSGTKGDVQQLLPGCNVLWRSLSG